ncbi:MAG: glycosyltransferase family 39 protein [bacterium]|nr:glycosyltransferase family 39 protein [bacterium]
MDELAHLPAGYSYLTQKDMRLNPEHPPLIKDLAALPLLFVKGISFPADSSHWQKDVNGQWDFGNQFLFRSDNPAEKMIFWARIPMILVLLLLGFYVFKWVRELAGSLAGLLALFLFSFSPTLLAHGRLVTTDIAAAFGFFVATYFFLKYLFNPGRKNLFFAGLAFGVAQLLKFSTFILVPYFGLLLFLWVLICSSGVKDFLRSFFRSAICLGGIFVIGYVLVYGLYLFHVWNYPLEKQISDTDFIISSHPFRWLREPLVWMAETPLLRPMAQYFLGLAMVFQRGVGGNTTYFLGEISATGWKEYFPLVYLLKEPISLHILTLVSIFIGLWQIIKAAKNGFLQKFKEKLEHHFQELAAFLFILLYWLMSVSGNLNIGVRHLAPVIPFTILLISSAIAPRLVQPFRKLKIALLVFLFVFQALSVLWVFPSFLAYFNELAGGPDKGYRYVADSNLDWGQDLKRLKIWLDKNQIKEIYLDYFGGSDTRYYLGEKYRPWQGDRNSNQLPKGSYLAVSATLLQSGRGAPTKGFNGPAGYYKWLDQYEPVAKIGHSIFIYKIE